MGIKQITIIGTGLIGGSLGLSLRAAGLGIHVVGCDRDHILSRARKLGAIDEGSDDPAEAVKGSDIIFLATPVGAIIDLIERIGPTAPPDALITDTGSTKKEIVDRARSVFGDQVSRRFLGGHPMAGKEHGSIFSAEPALFRDTTWLLVPPNPRQPLENERVKEYRQLLEILGAHIMQIEAERHDRLCAWISH